MERNADSMKYERPQLMTLNAEQGAGWCNSGSGARMDGGVFMYCYTGATAVTCTTGTGPGNSAAYCLSGNGNTTPAEQCLSGATVGNPPACLDGAGAI